jgi:hypothetical protein
MIEKVLSSEPKHLFAYADILVYNGVRYPNHTSAYVVLWKALTKDTNSVIDVLMQK